MKFTNTDCISYDIYWGFDTPIYQQLNEKMDDQVRWDWIMQVGAVKAYEQIYPIIEKIEKEVKK